MLRRQCCEAERRKAVKEINKSLYLYCACAGGGCGWGREVRGVRVEEYMWRHLRSDRVNSAHPAQREEGDNDDQLVATSLCSHRDYANSEYLR